MERATRPNLLRARTGEEARVEFVELFFDLVFVLAVTQLSHRLIAHPDAIGAFETLVLFVAVWWSWINTAWVTNWLDPHRTRVRLLLFAMMAAGLVMSMSIPRAFADRAVSFAAAYVAMEIVRTSFTLVAMRRHDRANFLNFLRILVWQLAAASFWIAGALIDGEARLRLWVAAVLVWSVGPIVYFALPGFGHSRAEDWNVEPRHLAERCGLFIILALGESVLVMGATFSEQEWSAAGLLGLGVALAATIAMWWLYFNIGAVRASRAFAGADAPGRVARQAYTYLHIPIVAGIIVAVAAVEWVAAHPRGPIAPHVAAAVVGGPALYLLGLGAFKRVTGAQWWPLSHLAGLGALAAIALAQPLFEPFQFGLAAAAVIIAAAVWETISLRTLHRAHADGEGDRAADASGKS